MLLWHTLINYVILLLKGLKGEGGQGWGGWESLFTFLLNIVSRACLLGSGLKLIFRWWAQWLILAKSLLISAAELSLLCTTENKEESSANNLILDNNSSAKSFMYIKKNSGPIIKPFGTPALTLIHIKTWSFKTTFYFLFLKKSHNKFKNLPDMPFCFNLKIIPSCHTLLNAFDISRKTLLTSNPSSDNLYISCVIDKNWLTQKSPGLKPY